MRKNLWRGGEIVWDWLSKPYAEQGFRVGIGFSGLSGLSDFVGFVSLAGFFRYFGLFVGFSVFFWCPVGASQVREPVKTAIP